LLKTYLVNVKIFENYLDCLVSSVIKHLSQVIKVALIASSGLLEWRWVKPFDTRRSAKRGPICWPKGITEGRVNKNIIKAKGGRVGLTVVE
jgi:hypothetical protein